MRVGEQLELEIEKGVYRGLGLARVDGRVIFVRRGLPGDRLRVLVESLNPGYARATPLELIEAGTERRTAPCAYFEACGGCAYQALEYRAQLALKEGILRESLARAGVAWDGPLRVRGSPEQGWRTRASFHVQTRGEAVSLGLREEGTHRVVDLPRCLQISSAMNEAFRSLARSLAAEPGLARRIRDVDLVESLGGERLVAVLDGELAIRDAAVLGRLSERVPQLTGLGALLGRAQGRRFLSLYGEPHVESSILGVCLRAHVRSFFQANRFLAEALAETVIGRVPAGGRVLDLYAGVGLFSVPLARRAEEVVAVERNPWAALDCEANAAAGDAPGLRVRRAEVAEALASLRVEPGERIVLDPPRTGAGAALVDAITARDPVAVVYVSCDPPTLGRDLKLFEVAGYRPESIDAFDLFPNTFHLETVVKLIR